MSFEMKSAGGVALMTIPVLIEVSQDIQACPGCIDWPLTIAGGISYIIGMALILSKKGD